MKEIWDAIKEWIIFYFHNKSNEYYCERCEAYENEIAFLRSEIQSYRYLLHPSDRIEVQEPNVNLQPIRRHMSLRHRIAKKESDLREGRKKESVTVADDNDKTEAEKIFESSINNG
jgi:hypothetical protein